MSRFHVVFVLVLAALPGEGKAQRHTPYEDGGAEVPSPSDTNYAPPYRRGPASRTELTHSRLTSVESLPGAARLIGPGGSYEQRYLELQAANATLEEAIATFQETVVAIETRYAARPIRPRELARINTAVQQRSMQLIALQRRHEAQVAAFIRMMERPSKGDGMIRICPRSGVYRY